LQVSFIEAAFVTPKCTRRTATVEIADSSDGGDTDKMADVDGKADGDDDDCVIVDVRPSPHKPDEYALANNRP
jgi:hypothetical protein